MDKIDEGIIFLIIYHVNMSQFLGVPLEKYVEEIKCTRYLSLFREAEKIINIEENQQNIRSEEFLKLKMRDLWKK